MPIAATGPRPFVALVSAGYARENWGSVDAALGKRIRIGTDGPFRDVVGVVADVYDDGADRPAPPTVYWTPRQHRYVAGDVTPL